MKKLLALVAFLFVVGAMSWAQDAPAMGPYDPGYLPFLQGSAMGHGSADDPNPGPGYNSSGADEGSDSSPSYNSGRSGEENGDTAPGSRSDGSDEGDNSE